MIEFCGVRWLNKLPYLVLGKGVNKTEIPIDAALAHRIPRYLEKLGVIPEPKESSVED